MLAIAAVKILRQYNSPAKMHNLGGDPPPSVNEIDALAAKFDPEPAKPALSGVRLWRWRLTLVFLIIPRACYWSCCEVVRQARKQWQGLDRTPFATPEQEESLARLRTVQPQIREIVRDHRHLAGATPVDIRFLADLCQVAEILLNHSDQPPHERS